MSPQRPREWVLHYTARKQREERFGFWRLAALGGAGIVCGALGALFHTVATQRSGGSCVPYDGPADGGCGLLRINSTTTQLQLKRLAVRELFQLVRRS